MEKYEKTICFMVDKDQCQIEAVEPRTVWIMPMGYEFDAIMLEAYAQPILSQLLDLKEERFGTVDQEIENHQSNNN